MAPSRRKGASKAAAAAAARRQWKVGDLVLAKVKGFPAWPAEVSEPQKWGYEADWKKVVVHFFGTQQIAFCNPVDVEAFTEEKKVSLLGKRHGKGSDFVRAVNEIIDRYEKLKRQEQIINDNCTDEVVEANENVIVTEIDDRNVVESFHKSGSKKEASSLGSGLRSADSAGDANDFNSLANAAVSELEKDGLLGEEVPSKEHGSNVVVTYSSRRKLENMQLQDCGTQRRVQPARRSRSSRVDTSRLQNFMLPGDDGNSIGDMAAMSRDRTGRRSKRPWKSPDGSWRHDCGSPLVSNGSIGENDPNIATLSDTVGFHDGIAVESGCKSMQPESAVEHCEPEVDISARLEFQNHAIILKKKRKPNRKRPSNDTIESTAGLDNAIASEAVVMSRAGHTSPGDHGFSERFSKEDGDEHLPLVKRARVRMGTSPHRPLSAGEQNDNQVADKMSEVLSSSKQTSMSLTCEENESAKGKSLIDKADREDISPLNTNTDRKPRLFEVKKNQPFSSLVDGEAALPPSKRLHRALEAMSANAAEDSRTSSEGPVAMKTSFNEYSSSSSGECFKVAVESREGGQVRPNDVESPGKTSFCQEVPKMDPSIPEDIVMPFQEVAPSSRPSSSDDYPRQESGKDTIETLVCGDYIHASSSSNNTADKEDAKQKLEISPHPVESGASLGRSRGSPGLIESSNDCIPESSTVMKPCIEPQTQNCEMSLDPLLGEENPPTSQNFTDSHLTGAESNCNGTLELSQLSLLEDKHSNAMDDAVKETGAAIKSSNATSSPTPEVVTVNIYQDQLKFHCNSISDDHLGDKAISATQSSSSVTDGLDSGPRASPVNTSAFHISHSNNSNNLVESNGGCSPEAHLFRDRPNHVRKLSSRAGPSVALASFEGVLGTLTRSKESIARATHIAIDCAKLGVASKVVEILTRTLETESSLHRRVDMFFLVDSITQCSRGMKGNVGEIYPSAIKAVLPRLLSAAAPPGSSSLENRRQCLKVLRVWQERRILPESIVLHHIRELDALCCSASCGAFSRSLKTERAFDDPIREMEGMMVDEYGSNSSIQLPGFFMPPMARDGDGGSDSDEENFEAVTPEHIAENPHSSRSSIPATDKHRHILEDVDGELEMEDVAPSCEADSNLISSIANSVKTKYCQFEHAAVHYERKAVPPSSPPLPVSPPPPLPPPPPPPPPPACIFTPSTIPDCTSNAMLYTSSAMQNIKDDIQESVVQQSIASRVNSVCHNGPDRGDYPAHVPMQMPDATNPSYSSQPHLPVRPLNNMQAADGAMHKGFHLRPPHPALSNQFSYVQADQRMQSNGDVFPPPNQSRYHMVQNTENDNFFRDRGRIEPAPHDSGDYWRSPAPPFSGPRPDYPMRPYGPVPFAGPPREPAMQNHRWDPRAMNRREFMHDRPHPGGPIPVASRGPNYWRPR